MKFFKYRNGCMRLDGGGHIMGILNVTPDSFSDGGKFISEDSAFRHAKEMLRYGAEIIDIGAMSTRPGSKPVTPKEEILRLDGILDKLKDIPDIIISVDTVNPECAEWSLENGAHIINDVSGFFNPKMASAVKKYDAGWIITHTGNVPADTVLDYKNGVAADVNSYFDEMLKKCADFGIEKEYMCLDPGFGFAKNTDENIELLKNLDAVIRSDTAFLTGLSRKRFIGAVTNVAEADKRVIGTVAANVIALMKGTDIIRVHDVREAAESVAVFRACLH